MVDNFQPPAESPTQEMPQAPGSEQKKGFFSSGAGRIVIAIIGVLVLALVAGAVAYVVFGMMKPAPDDQSTLAVAPVQAQSPQQDDGDQGETPPEEPEEVGISEVFTFRDIFEATVEPSKKETSSGADSSASGTTSGGSTSGGTSDGGSTNGDDNGNGSSTADEDTLVLEDIKSVDGEQVAVLTLNGQTYELTEGERVGDSPWEVLEIGTNSVVMLFGDTQVTLSIGQGLTK